MNSELWVQYRDVVGDLMIGLLVCWSAACFFLVMVMVHSAVSTLWPSPFGRLLLVVEEKFDEDLTIIDKHCF